MILTNARILTLDRDNSVFDSGSVKIRKDGSIGKNLFEIGALRGKDPYDAAFDLLLEEENAVGMVDFYGKEEHVVRFLTRPEQNVCTDGLLGGKPHPRVFGSFPACAGQICPGRACAAA